MIRWYPPEWRERYGPEMTALLEDTYATPGAVPWRARMGLLRFGLAERARAAGLYGSAPGPAEQVRAGSVLVLCGWALFLVTGAIFAKFADNWSVAAPSTARWVASDSYDAVAVLAALGCALVALAGCWRSLRWLAWCATGGGNRCDDPCDERWCRGASPWCCSGARWHGRTA